VVFTLGVLCAIHRLLVKPCSFRNNLIKVKLRSLLLCATLRTVFPNTHEDYGQSTAFRTFKWTKQYYCWWAPYATYFYFFQYKSNGQWIKLNLYILLCEPYFAAILEKNDKVDLIQPKLSTHDNMRYVARIPNFTDIISVVSVSKRLERRTDGRTDGHGHLPRPTLDTLRPLFPRFLYLSPGVTDDCLETRGPWFDAVRGVCCDKLCRSCSLVCGAPWVRCSFVLWNSSMQSRLAIGAL